AKDGDRMLAGRQWVRPPDPKVLIRISEDFAGPATPPVPPPPGVPGPRPPGAGGATSPGPNSQSAVSPGQDWAPGRGLTTDGRRPAPGANLPGRGVDLGVPLRAEGTDAPAPRPELGPLPPNITSIPPQVARDQVPAPVTTPAEPPALPGPPADAPG